MHQSEAIIVEQLFNSPVEEVWESITNKERMKEWFFEQMESFEPVVGFETRFNVQSKDESYLHIWRVTEVVRGIKITVQWKYGGYLGTSYASWELVPSENGTKLILTCTGLETFPQTKHDFTRESCTAGWQYFICNRLKEYLGKGNM